MKKYLSYNFAFILLIAVALSIGLYSYATGRGSKEIKSGDYNPIPEIGADANYGKDFLRYDSELGFSFKYPKHLFVSIDPENPKRIMLLPESLKENKDAPLSAIIISVAENDENMTAEEWLLGPTSGFKHSDPYYKTTIDGQDAVYTEGGMWTVVNTPNGKDRLSIADLTGKDADILFTEMGIVIESLTFRDSDQGEKLCRATPHTAPLAQEITYDKEIKKDAFVQYLRVALDNYISGKFGTVTNPKTSYKCENTGLLRGKQCPDGANDEEMGEFSLGQIDKSYLQSKFIVLGTDQAPGGGESITLFFKDRPDKIFYAWVYDYGDEGFDLRGFGEHKIQEDETTIEEVHKTTINQICAKNMGI